MTAIIDFAAVFARLAALNASEETTTIGGMNMRMVRIPGGETGRWDSHAATTETVVVWSGVFQVEFRARTLALSAGQCCVIPSGTDHRGTSPTGAEVILFTMSA